MEPMLPQDAGDEQKAFNVVLHDGVVAKQRGGAGERDGQIARRSTSATTQATTAPSGGTGMEIRFVADTSVYDGRFANNGWLQECPTR